MTSDPPVIRSTQRLVPASVGSAGGPGPSSPSGPPSGPVSGPPSPRGSSSVPPNLSVGQRLAGKYQLVRRIGSGAMGEVWAAKHLSLEEEVAIKIVLRDVEHEDGTTAESRFLLEARVAATLSRKTRHIVAVTDHGEDGQYAYLVMDLLKGESLDVRLARTGPMPLSKAVPIVYQIARALTVAHASGIVHRDLKPSNVFLTRDEDRRAIVKILDFGIAKIRAVNRMRVSMSDTRHKTLRGFLLGTPPYMSPEQARAKTNLDHRVDVWALGVMVYHLLTTQYPFDGETPEELFARLCRVEPIPIRERCPDLPLAVDDFFRRAFAEKIEDRFQSAVALAGAFEQLEVLSRGGTPRPMPRITIPPRDDDATEPAPIIIPPAPASFKVYEPVDRSPSSRPRRMHSAHKFDSSITPPAGVPLRRSPYLRIVGAVVLVCLLLGAGALLSTFFQRDRGPNDVANVHPGTTTPARETIPPPEPVAAAAPAMARPEDLPTSPASPNTQARAGIPAPPQSDPPIVVEPDPPAPAAPAPPPAVEAAPAKRRYDKSDVF